MKNADIRTMGSGNAGFTNVLRSVGKGPAIFTITFDFIKGVLSAVAGSILVYSFVTASNPQLLAENARYGAYIVVNLAFSSQSGCIYKIKLAEFINNSCVDTVSGCACNI